MVVAREREEEGAGAEVEKLSLSTFTFHFHFCSSFSLSTASFPFSQIEDVLQVGARLARMEAALAKLLARSEANI